MVTKFNRLFHEKDRKEKDLRGKSSEQIASRRV